MGGNGKVTEGMEDIKEFCVEREDTQERSDMDV